MAKPRTKTKPPEAPPFGFLRDYVAIALDYAKKAADEDNGHMYGRWVRLAAQRFLRDLERAKEKKPPFTFSPWHGCDPCDFIEKLPHVEGTWKNNEGKVTLDIQLHSSDIFFLVQLFGFRSLDGTRRFTTAVKAIARKNAKSTLAAAIGLYCQACEGETGPQVISAATTGSQARIVFNIARRMVEKTPDLRKAFNLAPYANSIVSFNNGGSFKPINAKASTQDGLNPSTSIIDEIHAHKDHDLLNVVQSASGARNNPLFLFTTTEGYETPGPWPELRHFLKQVLLGVVEADHFLCVYYSVDEEDQLAGIKADDDFDESAWIKANPLMEVNPLLLREIRKAAIEAKQMPGKLSEFRIKRLNRQSATSRGYISPMHWKRCSGEVDLKEMEKHRCFGGLDLAQSYDLAALRLVWLVDGVLYTWGRRWCPEACIKLRSERGTIPYQGWVDKGWITPTPGEIIDQEVIEKEILELHERFNFEVLAYDQWNAAQLSKRLKDKDVPMRVFIQGTKSFHPAMKGLEELYVNGNLRHGGDPVLTWCASNVVIRHDLNMNMAPDRKKSFEKIDDMVALLMATGACLEDDTGEPTFVVV